MTTAQRIGVIATLATLSWAAVVACIRDPRDLVFVAAIGGIAWALRDTFKR